MKERYLGLDLGTKTCGVAISDITNALVSPKETITFKNGDYAFLADKLSEIIKTNKITTVVIGLPINMDGSKGFASERTYNFIPYLEKMGVKVETIDERLTSVMSQNILHECNIKSKNFGKKVDTLSAVLILEDYLRKLDINENK